MLVDKDHQGQGVGTALVKAIEEEAARLGFDSIYTSTDTAMGILERRGWQVFGTTESLRGPLTIYRWRVRGETTSECPCRLWVQTVSKRPLFCLCDGLWVWMIYRGVLLRFCRLVWLTGSQGPGFTVPSGDSAG